jgi:hypothetical protein
MNQYKDTGYRREAVGLSKPKKYQNCPNCGRFIDKKELVEEGKKCYLCVNKAHNINKKKKAEKDPILGIVRVPCLYCYQGGPSYCDNDQYCKRLEDYLATITGIKVIRG